MQKQSKAWSLPCHLTPISVLKAAMCNFSYYIESNRSNNETFCYLCTCTVWKTRSIEIIFFMYVQQLNLCQKLFFLQNMGENMLCTKIVLNVRNKSVHNMFSPGLSLEFSCIELVIQWTICRHMYCGLLSWCKNKNFWQRFTCTCLLDLLCISDFTTSEKIEKNMYCF